MRRTSPLFALAGLTAVFSVLFLATVPSAFAAPQNRISANITNGARAEVTGSVHPRARMATDLGPTAGDTKLSMSLRFSMTDTQSASLDQLLADQQDPASPRYHQWLTPTQFGAQFGLSQTDIATVTGWLAAQGFTVTGVANGRTFVSFDGTVAQADAAFGTSIHNLTSNGEQHYANITNISVPGALAGVVTDVTGLHDFRLKPRMQASAVKPAFTSASSGNHFLAPGDIYTIYQMNPLLNGSPAINGTGESIAIVGQVDIYTADIAAFRTASGLSTINLSTVHANGVDPGNACNTSVCNNGVPGQGDLEESSLDLEWSGSMAPAANIVFVNSSCALPGTGCGTDSMTWAVDNNLAPIVTTSYGLCEAGWGINDIVAANAVFKQANAQGQTIVAATGDSGATDCDTGTSTSGGIGVAIEGLAADFPASSPYVTGMGGTMFTGDAEATGSGTSWSATQYWAGTSGSDVISSALSYIPESPWNDISYDAFAGGGGGASAFFIKPVWQTGTGVPADGSRDVPDLSLTASDEHDSLLFCVNVALGDSCTNGYRLANGGLNVAGGTSFDSQIFGGMLALLEQKIGGRIGNANPTIYALANNASYYSAGTTIAGYGNVVFNDVTQGNNAMACTAGTPNCPNGGAEGYNAGSGYDLTTGWGSVNLSNLANDWNKVTALGTGSLGNAASATTLTASLSSVAAGSAITLTATVTGSAGTPTGNVQFLTNDNAVTALVTLIPLNSTTATATFQWTTSCAAAGQQSLSAVYSGDTNYQGSKGPAPLMAEAGNSGGATVTSDGSVNTNPLIVTITGTCPDFSFTPGSGSGVTVSGSNATVAVAAGGTIPSVTVTVAPLNGFSGTVAFSASGSTTTGYTPTVTFSPSSVSVSGSSSASTTVSLSGITADLRMPAAPGKSGPANPPWYVAGSGVVVAGLFLIFLPRRRRLGGLLVLALSVALAFGASGCSSSSSSTTSSGGSGGGTTNTNPYAGTYVVNVIATYSSNGQSTVHSSTITYNIQ